MNKYRHLAPRKPNVARRRCVTKISYPLEHRAKDAARKLGGQRGVQLWTYCCVFCLRWHLTSKRPKPG